MFARPDRTFVEHPIDFPTTRSLEVDFFRGVVLLIIAVDHITLREACCRTLRCINTRFAIPQKYSCFSVVMRRRLLTRRLRLAVVIQPFVDVFSNAAEIYRAYLFTAFLMLIGGLLIWLGAAPFLHLLPGTYGDAWSFNPFAWQLMFPASSRACSRSATISTRAVSLAG